MEFAKKLEQIEVRFDEISRQMADAEGRFVILNR